MEDKEIDTGDTKMLFNEGYYFIQCEKCDKPMGWLRGMFTFDYATDEMLCFDCAYELIQKMKYEQGKIYG